MAERWVELELLDLCRDQYTQEELDKILMDCLKNASKGGQVSYVDMLLIQGADPNGLDHSDRDYTILGSVLHKAIAQSKSSPLYDDRNRKYLSIIRSLIVNGGAVSERLYKLPERQGTIHDFLMRALGKEPSRQRQRDRYHLTKQFTIPRIQQTIQHAVQEKQHNQSVRRRKSTS